MYSLRRSFFIPVLLVAFTLNAQNDKILWGPEYKKEGKYFGGLNIISGEDDKYYVLMGKNNHEKLLTFNKANEIISEESCEFLYKGEKLEPNIIMKTKAGNFGIISKRNKSKNEWRILGAKFQNGTFGEVAPLYSHEFKLQVKFKFWDLNFKSHTNEDLSNHFVVSEDGSKIVYISALSTLDNRKNDKLLVVVFDMNMELLWEKIEELDYTDEEFDIKQISITNSGVVYFGGNLNSNRWKREYEYFLFEISEKGKKEYHIVLPDELIPSGLTVFENENENIIDITGLYSTGKKNEKLMGAFHGQLDLNTGKVRVKINSFGDELLSQLKSGNDNKTLNANRHKIRAYNRTPDGGFLLLSEYQFAFLVSGGKNMGNDVYYAFGNFMSIKLDSIGDLQNAEVIHRKVHSNRAYRRGYTYHKSSSNFYLYYDGIPNSDEKKEMKIRNYMPITKLIVFDGKGRKIEERKYSFVKEIRKTFSNVNAMILGDRLIFGGKTNKLAQGPGAIYGKKTYRFGSLALSK